MASATTPLTTSKTTRSHAKLFLWIVLFLAAFSVIFSTEIPILRDQPIYHTYRLQLIADRYLLIPHAIFGTIALLSGPIQFSTRIRRKHLQFHRILGRVYVTAVLLAGPIAIIISTGSNLIVGTWVQAGAWFVCTLAAFLSARNRHIADHRRWMVRSYALTFTFISLRVLNFLPWYVKLNDADATLAIVVATFLSVLVPDLAFSWQELTTPRS